MTARTIRFRNQKQAPPPSEGGDERVQEQGNPFSLRHLFQTNNKAGGSPSCVRPSPVSSHQRGNGEKTGRKDSHFDGSSFGQQLIKAFWLKGILVDKSRSPKSPEYWIENPIHCGYLRAFMREENNFESMDFLMEIDAFRDELLSDIGSWPSQPYKVVDKKLGLHLKAWIDTDSVAPYLQGAASIVWVDAIPTEGWPSTRLDHDAIAKVTILCSVAAAPAHSTAPCLSSASPAHPRYPATSQHVQHIWETFLSPSAPQQIFVPGVVLAKTVYRLQVRVGPPGNESPVTSGHLSPPNTFAVSYGILRSPTASCGLIRSPTVSYDLVASPTLSAGTCLAAPGAVRLGRVRRGVPGPAVHHQARRAAALRPVRLARKARPTPQGARYRSHVWPSI